jgi:hypothetical protein
VRIDGRAIVHGRDAIELTVGVVVVSVLESRMHRAIVASQLVSLFHRANEALPAISTTQSFAVVLTNDIVNLVQILTNGAEEVHITRHVLHAFERGNEMERYKSLGIHMLSKIGVLAQILDREIVFKLSLDSGAEQSVDVNGSERNCTHRRSGHGVIIRSERSWDNRHTRTAAWCRHAMEVVSAVAAATPLRGSREHAAMTTLTQRGTVTLGSGGTSTLPMESRRRNSMLRLGVSVVSTSSAVTTSASLTATFSAAVRNMRSLLHKYSLVWL